LQKCIVTKVDEEMASILQADKDLLLPTKKVIVDITVATTTDLSNSQRGNDLLSTSSKSMFRMTGTTATWQTQKPKSKVKL